ncbi:MAG: metallophosphoesterase [Armatimonadetes bacterium]|nr:metallophosphoesterase [Armatimonadota bacterium]
MGLLSLSHWLRSAPDRDLIRRWTPPGRAMTHELRLAAPAAADRCRFLALGDSGDSDAVGGQQSPQEAVAQAMLADLAVAGGGGTAELVLHLGDVVYMTGERRLYDRNFRRPYAALLTPESTVDNLVFQVPFLPVPGNHDYYDLAGWFDWVAQVPLLGRGLQALTKDLFAFSIPEGGSDMGRVYMDAFVDRHADTSAGPLAYRPGHATRLPNRYYHFTHGGADFFALDSNTLNAPGPSDGLQARRMEAKERIEQLQAEARQIDRQLGRAQRELDVWQTEFRERAAADPSARAEILGLARAVAQDLDRLKQALDGAGATLPELDTATVLARWDEAAEDLANPGAEADALEALESLDEAGEDALHLLRAVEGVVLELSEGPARDQLLSARAALEEHLTACGEGVAPSPPELCRRIHKLSEQALDVQRELADARKRARYRPADHDQEQFAWLDAGLRQAIAERPDHWRIVYLHHPLYTSIGNRVEKPDVRDLRENLLPLLQGRVHLVLAGHAHAFEWLRSRELPNVGLFVSGGGGQVSLRSSVLDASRRRYRERYQLLRAAGVVEAAVAGKGPAADDGENGPLFHYLRVDLTSESIRVSPVGVRRVGESYRVEDPPLVYHAAALPPRRRPWVARRLGGVEVFRDRPPRPLWG